MPNSTFEQPEKSKDAEIVVKNIFGLSSLFSRDYSDLHSWWYSGVAIFANREGYQFLAEHFQWLADRPIGRSDQDPGDHVHLTPHSDLCDEIDFVFNTLTPHNREQVLHNANANPQTKLCGTPIRQFCNLVPEMISQFSSFLETDKSFRESTVNEIIELISVLEKERARLESKL